MANNDIKMLRQAILDYLVWVDSGNQYSGNPSNIRYREILVDFLFFAIHKELVWQKMFTIDTLKAFQIDSGYKGAWRAIKIFSQYLHSQGKIDQPIELAKPQPQIPLPGLYEHYLLYIQQSLHVSPGYLRQVRRLLILLHRYLQKADIELADLKIEHLDAFMATFKVSENGRRIYRYQLRGFLKYLYHEQRIIGKNLAPLLVGPRWFQRRKPSKFLRPDEVKRLFSSLTLSTRTNIRTYAIVHLAYFLGLRPVEISRITLDDISFSKGELALQKRKADNPITLPVPEVVLKAIAAYVLKARPKSPSRHLFLTFHFPYGPMSSSSVVCYLCKIMKKAGLPSSGYWLRHTYAQNLLDTGRSFYEVKEMLGHDNIESTKVYLHIHTQLMRRVLFNETF
jgi:site-specific recombinase XerD